MKLCLLCALTALAFAQPVPRELRPAPENLNFAQGAPDAAPPGWYLGPEWFEPRIPRVFEALTTSQSCHAGARCATVRALRADPATPVAFLYQVVDVIPHRGATLIFRAAVRDDMGAHPVASGDWAYYEIAAPIDPNARDIEFGIQLMGRGAAWIDEASLAYAGQSQTPQERAIRAVVRKFADARNAHDSRAIAETCAEDAEFLIGNRIRRGRAELAAFWSSLPSTATRTIDSVELLSPDIALARVTTAFPETPAKQAETFILVQHEGHWTISVHQGYVRPPQ